MWAALACVTEKIEASRQASQLFRLSLKSRNDSLFEAERLDDGLRSQIFVNDTRQLSFLGAQLVAGLQGARREEPWSHDAQRESHDRRQRESPIERKQDASAKNDIDEAERPARKTKDDRVLDCGQVGRKARRDIARSVAHIKAQGKALQLAEHLFAEIVGNPRAEPGIQVIADYLRSGSEQKPRDEAADDPRQDHGIPRHDGKVDNQLETERQQDVERSLDHQRYRQQVGARGVGLNVRKQNSQHPAGTHQRSRGTGVCVHDQNCAP